MTEEELKRRYAPSLRLEGFDMEAQRRLMGARLLVVGCGALGSTAAMYAAASGTGHIALADFDTVDLSNLQRQVFFRECDAGKKKARLIGDAVCALNSGCRVEVLERMAGRGQLEALARQYDFIIDAADNAATTYAIDEAAAGAGIGYVTAGVAGWHAQVMTHVRGSARFSDIFPPSAPEESMLPCSAEGVFGPLTGMIASLEAGEAVKYLSATGSLLTDALLTVDLRDLTFSLLRL